ncbi:MAG: hypothetical protein ABIP95_02990 [Pelobium sp.]
MKHLYKTVYTLLITAVLESSMLANAQEVPLPSTEPQALPEPPMPPKFDEGKWQEWGENFKKNFDDKKWQEWGKKLEKSFEGFDEKMKNLDLASVEFDKKIKVITVKLKDFKIPEIPEFPSIPAFPAMPEIGPLIDVNLSNGWELGSTSENAIEKIKKLSKSYSVNADDILSITNNYGKIEVNTWNKSEIKVDVEVRAYANDEQDAQELLEGVTISNSKIGNQISFKTNIEPRSKSSNWLTVSFWGGGNNDKKKVEIYYTVYMPAKNAINLKTNYTNTIIPDMSGDVTINMNYGDFSAGKLSGKTNVKSNYGQLKFEGVEDATFNANYGGIKVANSKNINANLNYCGTDLGKLSGSATIRMNYSGGFKIASFDKDFTSLNINSNYSSVNLDFNPTQAFNFDVTTTYAGFKYDDNQVTITSKSPADDAKGLNSTKNYKGYYGKSPSGNIVIRSNYGGVKFN